MNWMEVVYLVCFFLGVGFAIISGLLSGVLSGHGGAHVDVGHHGTGDLHATVGDQVHFPLLSPVTISMFIATFGGTGVIYMKALHWPLYYHLPAAGGSAFVVAGIVFYLFYKIFQGTQGSSEANVADLIGLEAEIITAIPADGVGEIAYVAKETRYNAPARTVDNKAVASHSVVKIVKIVGGTYVVEKVR